MNDEFATFEDLEVEGAAAASAGDTDDLAVLPRLIRYALMAERGTPSLRSRLLSEICLAAPGLREIATTWIDEAGDGRLLAEAIDATAVVQDAPALRSMADVVRLISLPGTVSYREDHRRVALALTLAVDSLDAETTMKHKADAARAAVGWGLLAAGMTERSLRRFGRALDMAVSMGRGALRPIEWSIRAELDAEETDRKANAAAAKAAQASGAGASEDGDADACPPGFVRVSEAGPGDRRFPKREVTSGLEHVLGTDVPLQLTPDLRLVYRQLIAEYPYATDLIDRILTDLVGRPYAVLRPILIVGPAGAGKSRLVRRLAELLTVGLWRTDASAEDSGTFAGTARRWNTAEPCHPLLAIARAGHANPLVLIDEIDKAAQRNDHGRLWDTLLGLLERETSSRYPDPALQVELDLRHVSYIATANSIARLPAPLLDRFRVLTMPPPSPDHLDALLPGLVRQVATERSLDSLWLPPLTAVEIAALRSRWTGTSARHLKRLIDAILRSRDKQATRH